MGVNLTSVFVDDQEKALRFYTEVLGFVKKSDFPVGQAKWLTVVSPEGPDDIELLLEPNGNPAARAYQRAIFEQGILATSFAVEDVQKEYERMRGLGVVFSQEPTTSEWGTTAIFDDTCGDLIQIAEE
jgi:catechol 2,3-dioxygenase-like lactoylglutathione lyase family enzyme